MLKFIRMLYKCDKYNDVNNDVAYDTYFSSL